MPYTPTVPLGAATLNKKWNVEVNIGTTEAPNWVRLRALQEFKDLLTPTTEDTSDFDAEGWKSSTVTALEWGIEGKVFRKVRGDSSAAYDQAQEKLRLAAAQVGLGNTVEVRFFEYSSESGPTTEAYQGVAGVTWEPEGGDMTKTSIVAVKLMGQGPRTDITNPATLPAPAPTVTLLAPTSVSIAGGDLVIVTGTNFTGATAVEVENVAVDASEWEVMDDVTIALAAPAKSAGAYNVSVTTPAGESADAAANELTYA